MLATEMSEFNFVYVHQSIVDQVVAKGMVSKILAMLKMGNFTRKHVKRNIEEVLDVQDNVHSISDGAQAACSQDSSVSVGKKKPKNTKKAKGRGQKSNVVQEPILPSTSHVPHNNCDAYTQTDVDFEYYLELDEKEYEDYQAYQHAKMTQTYLVSSITEQDFAEYDYYPLHFGSDIAFLLLNVQYISY